MTNGITETPAAGIDKLIMDNRFAAPNHQRDYSWTEDEVRQLFEDIEAALEKESAVYFLGLMVFLDIKKPQLVVLDGQQRLATAVVIFSAIRSWLAQYSEYQADAAKIQDWFIGRSELGEKNPEPRLTMNSANDKAFNDFVIKSVAIADIRAALNKLKKQDRSRKLLEATVFVRVARRSYRAIRGHGRNIRRMRVTESELSVIQYFLRCVEEEAIRQAKGKSGELVPGTLTVEHVLPRNPGPEWKTEIQKDPDLVTDCAFRIGNTCLVSEKTNMKVGGKSFSDKKKQFASSELLTTKAVANHADWDRQNIDHHQAYQAKLVVSAWRFP